VSKRATWKYVVQFKRRGQRLHGRGDSWQPLLMTDDKARARLHLIERQKRGLACNKYRLKAVKS